jgi:hypothetical protein
LHLGGQRAGLLGLLTLLAKGHRPDVVAYSGDVELLDDSNQLGMQTSMNFGSSGFRVAHRRGVEDAAVLYPLVHELLCGENDSEISPPRRGGRRAKMFIKKYSELCVLGVSVVNLLSQ